MFNLKEIISSIADAGQKLFKKSVVKKNNLDSIISLCDDLISNKGAAFGITVARDITDLYHTLTPENKLLFFKKINEKYKPNHTKVTEAINAYKEKQDDKSLFNLFVVTEGRRREFFRRMNMSPNGISTIVTLREDLLKIEQGEIDLLSTYLPKQLSEEETKKICSEIITKVGAQTIKDMGKVMGELKKNYSDSIDFSKAGSMLKELLNK